MITLYSKNETDFRHNGICILKECSICTVDEEINGLFELELEYPIFGSNKWKELKEDRIIKTSTPRGTQLFRIYRKVKQLSSIHIYARHIFYDLLNNYIEDIRPTKCVGDKAIKDILNNTIVKNNFIGESDIDKISTSYYIRKNPIEAMIGDNANSFTNRWGGEIVRDNFTVKLLKSMGRDNGVTIRYGKNLIGIEEDLDMSEVVTCIIPSGLDEKDNVIELPEKYIYSKNISKYSSPKIKHIHFSDIKMHHNEPPSEDEETNEEPTEQEEEVTREDVYRLLREKVKELYEVNKIDIPKVNYKVNFVELSTTEQYKDYKILEAVNLGDTVTIKHKILDLNLKAKLIKYKWDCISDRYIELELGNFRKNITDRFSELDKKIEELKKRTNDDKTDTDKAVENLVKRADEQIKKVDELEAKTDKEIEEVIKQADIQIKKVNNEIITKTDELTDYIDSTTDNKIGAFKIETNKLLATKVSSENFKSYRTQTAKMISNKIADVNKNIESYRSQTADTIADVVKDTDNKLESYRTQTSKLIADKMIDVDKNLESYELQTAKLLATKVDNEDFGSYRTQTAEQIASKIATVNNSLKSYKTQTSDLIASKVSFLDNKLESYRTQSANMIADKISSDTFRTYKMQTESELANKVESSKFSSYTRQTDNRLDMVVDGYGNINAARIAMSIKNNSSAISMIADSIEIKPNNGVIEFPNGTSLDTRDSYGGMTRSNLIRLRGSRFCYILMNGNDDHGLGSIGLYFKSPGGDSHAYWKFTRGTLFKDGKAVL